MSSENIGLAVRIQAGRLKELLKWRKYLKILVEAAGRVFGSDAEVYVFGSAVEGKLTANSDIDIAIVVEEIPKKGLERAKLMDRLWETMESNGVPWWYPFEIHLLTREELKLLKNTKLISASKLIANLKEIRSK
ncbi:MAG: nucleotidyltransferase [Thermoprotei archaeon]|nr:MAG: nucleotidyltransferase [Thermoprotei archaeon]